MIRYVIAIVALATLAGCSSEGGLFGSGNQQKRTQMAAVAAQANYPSNAQPSSKMDVTALVDRDQKQIRIVNAGDQSIRDADVWVNGSFVTHVDVIPAHSILTLTENDFFDKSGQNMAKLKPTVNKVEIQQGQQLYSVQGPVVETK